MLRLAQIAIFRQNSQAIIVLEDYDAAGKGCIRNCRIPGILVDSQFIRLVHRARKRQVISVAFLNRLPAPGQIAIFDRSWYGRLLVGGLSRIPMVSMNRVFLKLMPLRRPDHADQAVSRN